jgi:HPt (histidine-containing phosphotransfer) domain-containing protein
MAMITNQSITVTALLTEVDSLTRQLETVTGRLRALLSGSGGDISERDAILAAERIQRYLSPGFTDQLIEHIHRAKKQAIAMGAAEGGHAPPS